MSKNFNGGGPSSDAANRWQDTHNVANRYCLAAHYNHSQKTDDKLYAYAKTEAYKNKNAKINENNAIAR